MDATNTTETTKAATIVRIIAVRDTRQHEEIGDRWVPIPGSGNMRECDRCGRTHEVHIDVELSDGTTAVIGAGCARGESMDVQSKIKSAVSAAKTLAKLQAELGRARADYERFSAAHDAAEMMPLPPIVRGADVDCGHGRFTLVYQMGDAVVWCLETFDSERERALISGWRHLRVIELGSNGYGDGIVNRIRDLETRIVKATRKLEALS